MTNGLLDGLNVVEVGDLGEIAGKLLADAGADVVRVEPPAGARSRHAGPFVGRQPHPDLSLKYAYLNTNKRSVVLDLDRDEGTYAWQRLVEGADIVIDAAGPGELDSRGAGSQEFQGRSQLIWCSLTPFGLTGPWRDRRSNDLVSMAGGGIAMMCGYDDHTLPPIRPEGDHSLAIGGEYAVIAILAALWQREAVGAFQVLDVSIHEAVAGTTEGAFMNWEYLGRNPVRKTGRHAGTPEEWQLISGEGDFLVLFGGGVPRDRRAFEGLLAWMDEYEAADDLHDPHYQSLLHTPANEGGELRAHFARTVAEFVATRPTEEVYRRGQAIGMPWAPVRLPEENLDDPHWADRDFWVTTPVNGHDTEVFIPRAGYRFTLTPIVYRTPAPRLGQHNREVLTAELGIDLSVDDVVTPS